MLRTLLLLVLVCLASPLLAAPKPAVADRDLDLTVTYCIHAKDLWHDAAAPDVGGYWGDGLAPAPDKNGNGNVRGMSNSMLGYAMLVHAIDEGWLTPDLSTKLQQAGLTRDELLRYIKLNLQFLNAHHLSTPNGLKPNWGFSWQSPLWLEAQGPAVLLTMKDLPPDIISDFKRVATAEADRVAKKPPKDYKPGDTGAEENAWDQSAPAVALAVDPTNPHAADWLKALKTYAVNVYSVKADQGQPFVCTANLFDDFTLENHGFFHPDYVQVSGQDLGVALLLLQMGDQLNGTKLAEEFKPFAMHHLADAWTNVMRNLLLGDGQFAFPNGTDWTIHTSIESGYLACISTLLNDPMARDAESRHVNNALRHRAMSPPGRIFGDTNMEWWWEPLLIQRFSHAILQHEYRDTDASAAPSATPLTSSKLLPDAKVFIFRNDDYFASIAWGEKHMATFYPTSQTDSITLPIESVLPRDIDAFVEDKTIGDAHVAILKDKGGKFVYGVFLPHSVVWISPSPFRSLAIENDAFSGGKRHLFAESTVSEIPMLSKDKDDVSGNWANIDDRLGVIADGGFQYGASQSFNHTKTASFDPLTPMVNAKAWQMIAQATHEQTRQMASKFSAKLEGTTLTAHAQDGITGYQIQADFKTNSIGITND
jgi:hypothetical protein